MIDPWIAIETQATSPILDSIFSEPRVPYPYPQLARSRMTRRGHQFALCNRISSQSRIGGIRSTQTCCDESENPGSADLAGFN